MRSKGILAVALLSVSILSYGFNGFAFADNHDVLPISISSDSPTYGNGDRVTLTGKVKDYDPDSGTALTLKIMSPGNALVNIAQIIPESDGSFTHTFVAGGTLWKNSGDYIVDLRFGATTGEFTIVYSGGELEPEPPEPVTCGPNQDLVNGKCIDKEPEPPEPVTCGPNQDLVNGKCIDKEPEVTCGEGTELVDGMCTAIQEPTCPTGYSMKDGLCVQDEGGACLIATAAFGSELAPQVQFLREVRDNTVLSTGSGIAFMSTFNQLYYSFSPTIADWERESPIFKEAVKLFITPMISTLSIMTLAENGSESNVLTAGISVIVLNLAMYIAAPALVAFKVNQHLKSRK